MTVIFPFCPSRQYTLSLFRFFSVLALLAASGFSHAAEFAGGTGDAGSPYEIATAEQLDAVRDHLDSHFELTADIDLGGNAWSAIGNYNASFTGVLDGNGHAITGLNINFNSNDTHKGLFGALRGAQIRNLRVLDAVITSSASTFVDRVGILSGQAREFSTVSNVFVSGAVQAANYVGGLIGTIEDSTLRDTGADVHVEGTSMVGGLIGANFNTVTIERSFALGNVDAVFSHIGGLVGEARTLEVHDSFARGAVTAGGSRVGGLLGWAENDVSVNNSYATGQVDAPDASDTPGGLIGNADGSGNTVEASYWDTVTSGQSSSDGGTGSDTGEMTDAGSITAPGIFSSWDFDATWGMDSNLNGGYPVLLWDVAAEATLDIQAPAGNLSEPALPQTFTWNTGTTSSLVSYDFQLARDAGFNDIVLEQSGLDTPSVDGPVLEKDTEYHWRVRAVVGDSIGQWQSTTFTTPAVVFAGGQGSSADPWQIASAEQLDLVRGYLSDHFVLTADIDLGGSNWESIGPQGTPFTGELDGAGHTISGLYINSGGTYQGLFGALSQATVTELTILDADITTSAIRAGVLAGQDENESTISHVYVSGQIEAAAASGVGGLVGGARRSTISNSGADVTVRGMSTGLGAVGGLVGFTESAQIQRSFALGNVEGGMQVGGLVGYVYGTVNPIFANIDESFARGDVTGSDRVGGLVGHFAEGIVRLSYASGLVNNSDSNGGLIGLDGGANNLGSSWDTDADSATFDSYDSAPWDIDPNVNDGYPYLLIPVSTPGNVALQSPANEATVTGADPAFVWDSAYNAAAYEVEIADNESFESALPRLDVADGETQIDMPASLESGTVYYWRVRAINPGGIAGAWSSANAFYTGELAPPALSVSALDPDFVEGDAAVQLFDAAAATVRTGQLLQSLTLTVSGLGGAGDEWLVIDGSDVELQDGNSVSTADTGLTVAVAVAVAGATATVSVTGASLNSADMNALVNGIRYRNDGDIATSASREITLIELQDDGGTVFADENTTVLALASVISLSPPSAPVTPPASGSTIGGIVTGATLNGVSTILPGGGLNGGVINGTVNNEGEITGDVSLGASATINGGLVSGNISGQPSAPGRIVGATVSADAQLSHVVIGEGTVLEPGVELGAGVRFASVELIPEDTELAQTLPQLNWNGDDSVSVPDLNASVLASGERTLASLITDLPVFGEQLSEAGFDSQLGEFSLMLDDGRAALLPVSVQRHDGDEEVRVTADGHVLFASPDGLRIELVPVLVSAAKFASVLNEDIGLELASNGSVLVAREPGPSTDAGAAIQSMSAGDTPELSYVVRPGLLAVPAYRHDEPGLHFHAMPGLGNVQGMSQVFESVDGTLLEQDIIAAPADWDALSELLWQLGDDVRDVRINELGLITVEQDAGILRLRVELLVREGAEPAGDPMYYTFAGDLSGNGVADYWLIYPNGDRQAIFLYR